MLRTNRRIMPDDGDDLLNRDWFGRSSKPGNFVAGGGGKVNGKNEVR